MKIIANKNCTGKTKELIRESLDTNTPILALTPLKANSLREKSISHFNEEVNVIDFEGLKNYNGNILIDDIDEVIGSILKKSLNNPNIDISGFVVNI